MRLARFSGRIGKGILMNRHSSNLAEKLDALSPEQIAEVEDFVDFLRIRTQDRTLAQMTATMSASSFEAVWDNPEDEAYDAL